jgi:hypothetical protein
MLTICTKERCQRAKKSDKGLCTLVGWCAYQKKVERRSENVGRDKKTPRKYTKKAG